MRRLALVLALCACAPGPAVELAPGQSLAPERFRRLAVAPFADATGQGRLIAAKVVSALAHLDYGCVDPAQLETVMASARRDPNEEISPEQLAHIRRLTLADGLVLGEVSSTRRTAGVALLDTATGDVILRARLRPREDVFESSDEIAEAVARVFSERRSRPKAPPPGAADDELPDPQ